jgi:hypothetical protein
MNPFVTARSCVTILAVAVALVLGLTACSGGGSGTSDSASTGSDSHVGMSDLEASLTSCKDSQGAAIDAIQGSDKASALSTLDSAETSCRAAAASLRRTPLPGHPDAATGLDQAADGFHELKRAVSIMDRSPTVAQRKAHAATSAILAGMKKAES